MALARERILDSALALMSERGVAGTSMRKLAGECGLNVATIYHYFPSKADLLKAVIAERGYLERMATDPVPASVRRPATAKGRLEALLRWIWTASGEEEAVWRLLVGESLRGEPAAQEMSAQLVEAIDAGFSEWIRDVVPELSDRALTVAHLCRALLFALIVEHLALGPDDRRVKERIAEFAAVIVPT